MNTRTLAALLAGGLVAAGGALLLGGEEEKPPVEEEIVDESAQLKAAWTKRVEDFKKLAATDKDAPTAVLQVQDKDRQCWLLKTGGCCRYGRRGCEPTKSGLNGEACPYDLVTGQLPCVVDTGAGSERTMAADVWEAKE